MPERCVKVQTGCEPPTSELAGSKKSTVILLRLLPLASGAICRPGVQECLELVNRREEIVYILALVFQIPRDSSSVRDRLFREPLARFLPEFRRLRPFHSLACHRAILSDDCQPEIVSRVLSAIVTKQPALTNGRIVHGVGPWRYL